MTDWTEERIAARVRELGPWFHNLDLKGVRTAPDHFLYDYPNLKWQRFAGALPADLSGKSVLDIGCNAGFYSMQMKRRGAERVVGIDVEPKYLAQARFAADIEQLEIEFRQVSAYDVAALGERFDIVLFLGVLYHLRHPLLALDLIREHVADDMLVLQSMQRGGNAVLPLEPDYDFWDQEMFAAPGDPTNWWAPNRACTEAMLRSAGFEIVTHPEEEVFVCRKGKPGELAAAVYPARGATP